MSLLLEIRLQYENTMPVNTFEIAAIEFVDKIKS